MGWQSGADAASFGVLVGDTSHKGHCFAAVKLEGAADHPGAMFQYIHLGVISITVEVDDVYKW